MREETPHIFRWQKKEHGKNGNDAVLLCMYKKEDTVVCLQQHNEVLLRPSPRHAAYICTYLAEVFVVRIEREVVFRGVFYDQRATRDLGLSGRWRKPRHEDEGEHNAQHGREEETPKSERSGC